MVSIESLEKIQGSENPPTRDQEPDTEDRLEGEGLDDTNSETGQVFDESFGWGSDWDESYHDILDKNGQLGRFVKWVPLQKWIAECVAGCQLKQKVRGRGIAGLFAGVITEKEQQAQQIYTTPPDAPLQDIRRTKAKAPKQARFRQKQHRYENIVSFFK